MADVIDLLNQIKATQDPVKKAALMEQMKEVAKNQTPDEMMSTLKAVDQRVSEIEKGIELDEIADMASMSYIAEKYFQKSRAWLYQRINGNIVNGKPAKFTTEEKATFARALDDMAKKFKEKSLSITNG